MTDYTKLVAAVRDTDFGDTCVYCEHSDMCKDADCIILQAAAAIEALQAEVDKANKSADAYRAMYFTKRGDITIEKVRELDEIDYHFHSALIRLMYKRIEKLESELEKKRTADCWGCKCEKMEVQDESVF